MLRSKTLADWNSYVVKRHMEGNPVNLSDNIRNWMIFKQRTTTAEILQYAYKVCGEEYRSNEFDMYLRNTIKIITRDNKFDYDQLTDTFVVNLSG